MFLFLNLRIPLLCVQSFWCSGYSLVRFDSGTSLATTQRNLGSDVVVNNISRNLLRGRDELMDEAIVGDGVGSCSHGQTWSDASTSGRGGSALFDG